MTNDRNVQQLLVQVSRAREALGNALGLVQDLHAVELDLSAVAGLLAGAVRALFAAQEQQLQSAKPINEAMQYLRDILQMMQNVPADDTKLQAATSTVARILAILFPVLKALSVPPVADDKNRSVASDSVQTPRDKAVSHQPKPTTPEHDERRSAPRKAIEADIGMQSDSNFFTGFSTDISSGGLFIATYDMHTIGTLVNLNFRLPNGPVISVDGEVRWSREYNETTPDTPPGVGVRFLNLDPQEASQINAYMQSVQPMFFDED
ncbi:MAG: TIGR02266 family protein [Deltaproteobacteria bacterium]|nr:TIGR02266 family protein [Deltaproteobacteria bacterium]MBN2670198.1 TIGR02266 family protein [Deltaproteobacteria bacterium]